MTTIFQTIWGNTRLARAALSVGCLCIFGIMLVKEIDVPTWFQTLGSTSILSYFVGRATESPPAA